MKKQILLVAPLESSWAHTTSPEFRQMLGVKAVMPPLGLATVAALTPEAFDVSIHDENVHGPVEKATFGRLPDLVGISGFDIHRPRVLAIATFLQGRGFRVAIGGPGISSAPEGYDAVADYIFIGEAEHTWPEFLRDWEAGRAQRVYRQIEKPTLSESPPPRWASLGSDLRPYASGTVQTTRGCPFDCEFCDVIYLYGRKPRHKPIANVIDEIRKLEQLRCYNIFICDDNFVGDPGYAKAFLRAVISLNESFARPLSFRTQLTIDVAKDDELLGLMADANFAEVFIGIESPNPASLRGMNKPQNLRSDLATDVRKIMSFGIPVTAGMIVGCDEDDLTIFKRQFDFIQHEAGLFQVALAILNAPRGTKLFHRLRREGRVLENDAPGATSGVTTNILPKQMSRVEVMEGLAWLLTELNEPRNAFGRIRGVIRTFERQPRRTSRAQLNTLRSELGVATRVWAHFLFRAPPTVRKEFLKTVAYAAWKAPAFLDKAILMSAVSYLLGTSSATTVKHLRAQIEQERKAGPPRAIPGKATIAPAFRPIFQDLFPRTHATVTSGLNDRSRVNEALVEVFVDVLDRWRDVTTWGPEHEEFLSDVCGRTIAKLNQSNAPARGGPQPAARHLVLLREDIYKAVEQAIEAPFLQEPGPLVQLKRRAPTG